MKSSHWCLLVISSFLYVLSFLYTWWLIFIFPIPLLYVGAYNDFSFKHGFIGSFFTFLLHMVGGMCVVVHMAHNAPVYGFIFALSVISIQAFFIGILFWIASFLNYFTIYSLLGYRLCKATCLLFFFILWVDRYCLWIFDVVEGYPLMHPLLPLVQCPALLWLLPIIGKNCLTILFLCVPLSIVILLLFKNRWALLLCMITFFPWVISFYVDNTKQKFQKPLWLSVIKPVPYMIINAFASSQHTIKIALNDISTIIDQHEEYVLFVMPESSIAITSDIMDCDVRRVSDERQVHLVFGVSHMRHNRYYNSLVWVYNKKICYCFDKSHAMILSERLSTCLNNSVLKDLYCKVENAITLSSTSRAIMNIEGVCQFVPYICSELFFNEYPDDEFYDVPILLIVNDSVFLEQICSRSICWLLQLLTQFKAIAWQREIVYVSYSQSFYCNKKGDIVFFQ